MISSFFLVSDFPLPTTANDTFGKPAQCMSFNCTHAIYPATPTSQPANPQCWSPHWSGDRRHEKCNRRRIDVKTIFFMLGIKGTSPAYRPRCLWHRTTTGVCELSERCGRRFGQS
jgi:hypothetical protein